MYKKKLHSLIILIPSYNELENLKKFVLRLKFFGLNVVNDNINIVAIINRFFIYWYLHLKEFFRLNFQNINLYNLQSRVLKKDLSYLAVC